MLDANILKLWWARGNSNARPLPCQGSATPSAALPDSATPSFHVQPDRPSAGQSCSKRARTGQNDYGKGGVYLRGSIWWVQYYRDGVKVRESAKTEDRIVAESFLKVRRELPDVAVDVLEEKLKDTVLGLQSRQEAVQAHIGATAELMVACDLMNRGYEVFRALSPSTSCDLVAIKGGRVLRIEAKTVGTKWGKPMVPRIDRSKSDHLAMVVRKTGIVYDPPLHREFARLNPVPPAPAGGCDV